MYEDRIGESYGGETPMGMNIKASDDLEQIVDSFWSCLDKFAEAKYINV
jgi:hypothetical protein